MNVFKLIFIFVLIVSTSASECLSSPEQTQAVRELELLKELFNQGHKNAELLLRLSNLSPNSAEALCYARLGLEVTPNSIELKSRIDSLRNNSKINEDIPTGIKTTVSSPSFFVLMNFISKNQLSLILFTVSAISLILFVARYFVAYFKQFKALQLILYSISILLFVQIFLIVKTKDGRFRFVSSLNDFNKLEGVVLSERNVYSAPSETSQQVNILKPSWEINVFGPDNDSPWVYVETSDKRHGWINGISSICLINHNRT